MDFSFQSYQIDLNCSFQNNQIICEGYVWKSYKFLRFPVGCSVRIKFGHKSMGAKIKRYTKSKCVLTLDNGKEKRVSFQELIRENCYNTEICVRIEKNGIGPYRCTSTKSEEFLEWKKEAGRLFKDDEKSRSLRPAPEEDSGTISMYYGIGRQSLFAFESFEKMFEWFPLSEVSFLISQGFSVVIKQKGLDYYDSFKSYKQMAIVRDLDTYNQIINNPVREYL